MKYAIEVLQNKQDDLLADDDTFGTDTWKYKMGELDKAIKLLQQHEEE